MASGKICLMNKLITDNGLILTGDNTYSKLLVGWGFMHIRYSQVLPRIPEMRLEVTEVFWNPA